MAITQVVYRCVRHITQIPAPVRGYSDSTHLRVSDEFAQTDPVAMVTYSVG